jgi:CelD/BcsL family acetyltransferase involved in cellulose biosynthesis
LASLAPLELLPSWQLPETIPCSLRIGIVARPWRDFERPGEVERWDALAQWASEPNPFHESWYLLPSLRLFDAAGEVVLLCLEADGQLAGLLPLKREGRYYGHPLPHWRNWLHSNMFLGAPLVAPGFEAAFWRELLAWGDSQAAGTLFLHLSQMPAEGPLHEALARVLREENHPAATVMREERAMLRTRLEAGEYLELSLSGKKRKELRRQHRRLEEEGELSVERTMSCIGLSAWIDEFLELERAGWKGKAGSALACDPATEALFTTGLEGAARQGRLERLAIRLDGKPLAMLATFLSPPGAFSYKTAFDERYARFSPGVLLQRENLSLLARPEIEWADSCASADHPMIDHFWRERRSIARHSIGIGGPARRLLFRVLAAVETRGPARGVA